MAGDCWLGICEDTLITTHLGSIIKTLALRCPYYLLSSIGGDEATNDDMKKLEQALKDKYPSNPIDAKLDEVEDLTRIEQEKDGPLSQYFSRVSQALRRAGGKDESNSTKPLTPNVVRGPSLPFQYSPVVPGPRDEEYRCSLLYCSSTPVRLEDLRVMNRPFFL
ncbi:uncharacterized protein GGS22DRAFT_56117 [Annulohypoxylon maeteangense]|uniref:uncharacterized protein n=1 Tax=Annulohypoxylon maeteangense TaxID=1927788 RepID=UPI002007B8C0|nr:uncharacterized protein GGS22DRAFT_56117 [Annulohypoxylon maeteangense]KAI0881768.1 hypothetical protein GGS22DRAFT_56117 [Annulohypoxylon maeteangense]